MRDLKTNAVHNKMLEIQLAQMTGSIKGASTTQLLSQGVNPNEQAHAIITRSGRQLGMYVLIWVRQRRMTNNGPIT